MNSPNVARFRAPVWVARLAVVVTLVTMVFVVAIASGASTAQVVGFFVTVGSALIGVVAGCVVAFRADGVTRRRAARWSSANLLVGLACVALELLAFTENM